MFEQLCENLKLLMDRACINANELARKTGIPASTIKKIRNNDNPNPTLSTLIPLAKYFSISLSQLIGDSNLFIGNVFNKNCSELPIISWNEAITWPCKIHKTYRSIKSFNSFSENAFALEVETDGITDLPRETMLFFDPELEADHMDTILVHKEPGVRPSLKQIIQENDQMYLKPLMNGLTVSQMTDDHKIIGVLVETQRSTKKKVFNRE